MRETLFPFLLIPAFNTLIAYYDFLFTNNTFIYIFIYIQGRGP